MVLTVVTVAVSFVNLGGWNIAVALAIASLKAALVAFVFMHLWYDKKIFFIVFTSGLVFLAVFIVLTMFDTLGRGEIDRAVEDPIEQEAVIYRKAAPPAQADPSDSVTVHEQNGH